MSATSQSRDKILQSFHEISGLNIEDCIQFLNCYNWNLEDIVNDFYNKKDFKKTLAERPNENSNLSRTFVQNSNSEQFYMRPPSRQNRANESDDQYMADLIAQYGDADTAARRNWRESQQQNRSSQYQENPSQNTKTQTIYHEKQKYLRCGIHSLNNLFQTPEFFNHQYLDSIVEKFDKRSINNDYGEKWIGDYDLRILIEAITQQGHTVRQINFYNGEPLQNLPWDSYFGLLLNINGAHWFTIKYLNGFYYNLDSTFSKPSQIGKRDALIAYLIHLIQRFRNIYIFAVLQQQQQVKHR